MFIYTIEDVVFIIFLIVILLSLLGFFVYGCYIGWREKKANKYSNYCREWYLETFDDATKEDAERFAKKCCELRNGISRDDPGYGKSIPVLMMMHEVDKYIKEKKKHGKRGFNCKISKGNK